MPGYNTKTIVGVLVLAVAALAAPAFAALPLGLVQEPGSEATSGEVTEQDLLDAVGPDHPAVSALAERIGVADAEVLRARILETPELGAAREDPSGDGAPGVEQLDVTLSWQLPSRSRRAAVAAAGLRAEAARAAFELDRRALRFELRSLFASWALATERVRILESQGAQLSALAKREAERAERGEVSGLRARRLKLAASTASTLAASARAEAESARLVVAGWSASVAEGRPVLPAAPPRVEPVRVEADTGIATHPRLVELERELAAAQSERDGARRFDALPEVMVGWQRQDDGVSSLDGPLLGLSWRVPLIDPNRAERASATARVLGTEARLEQESRALKAEVAAAAASLGVLIDALDEARSASQAVTPLVAGTVRAFELGEVEVFELLDVLRSATETELRVVDVLGETLAAQRRYELFETAEP